jgi:catechol 2,3-dioxygenase-like lactoylglutathione lyase family enzyme
MPIQAERGNTTILRVGDGPQFLSVSPTADGEAPSISHICMSVPDFDVDSLLRSLSELGIMRIDPPEVGSRGIDNAMRSWVRIEDGGTPEVYFADARGLVMQLQDASYCGGTGPLGNVCLPQSAEPAGEISLGDLNHFTVFVSDGPGAISFYQDAMGLAPQAYQATTPALGVGDGIQFLMFAGGGGGRGRGGGAQAPTPANIHHASFNMDGFDTEGIRATLTDHGLSASDGNTGPLVHYISLRMPNRGGAEGGTPELYFTDPDGLLMQIQDSSYCGGGGVLGNVCEG